MNEESVSYRGETKLSELLELCEFLLKLKTSGNFFRFICYL